LRFTCIKTMLPRSSFRPKRLGLPRASAPD
jgi:hypothetical protein